MYLLVQPRHPGYSYDSLEAAFATASTGERGGVRPLAGWGSGYSLMQVCVYVCGGGA